MNQYISGHGKTVTIGNITLRNTQFSLSVETVLDEVTNSQSGGYAEAFPVLKKLASLEVEAVDDGTAGPLLALINQRTNVQIQGIGAFSNVIVNNVQIINDQQRVRRIRVSCSYGSGF